jgi:hypothetical protein
MADQSSCDSPGRKAAAYWFIDGLPEIVVSLIFIAMGCGHLYLNDAHLHPRWVRATMAAIDVALVVVILVFGRSMDLFLKSRITFPRTGYVRPPCDWREDPDQETVVSLGLTGESRPPNQNVTRFTSSIFAAVVLAQVLAGVIARPIGLAIAMSSAAILLYVLRRHSERPYHWAAVLLLPLVGIAAMRLPMGADDYPWAATLIGGAWLALQGAWRLIGYVRRYPRHAPLGSVRP